MSVVGFALVLIAFYQFSCSFDSQVHYELHPAVAASDENARNTAIVFYKEACQNLVVLVTAKKYFPQQASQSAKYFAELPACLCEIARL